MRIGDNVDLPPGVDRLPKSVSLKCWIGQIFLNPPPRPFQFIVFTASTDTYKRLRLTTGDRIHVCSLNSDFDLSVEEEIFRKHWDVLHSIPLAKWRDAAVRSEEHTSELQSLMRISYAVFCLKKKKTLNQ